MYYLPDFKIEPSLAVEKIDASNFVLCCDDATIPEYCIAQAEYVFRKCNSFPVMIPVMAEQSNRKYIVLDFDEYAIFAKRNKMKVKCLVVSPSDLSEAQRTVILESHALSITKDKNPHKLALVDAVYALIDSKITKKEPAQRYLTSILNCSKRYIRSLRQVSNCNNQESK